jgi:hypothetical protein
MPFRNDDGSEVTAVALLQRDARRFQLVRGFRYVDSRTGAEYPIPAHDTSRPPGPPGHNSTDLASVPLFLWGLIPSYGLQTRAALLHDELTSRADEIGGDHGWQLRRQADELFRRALLESEVPLLRALLMWAGVSAYRYTMRMYGLGRVVLGTGQLALGVLAVYAGILLVILGSRPLWLLLLLVPVVLAFVARRDRDYFLIGSYLSALVLPIVALAWLLSRVFWVLNWVVWLAAGRAGPAPTVVVRRFGAKPL